MGELISRRVVSGQRRIENPRGAETSLAGDGQQLVGNREEASVPMIETAAEAEAIPKVNAEGDLCRRYRKLLMAKTRDSGFGKASEETEEDGTRVGELKVVNEEVVNSPRKSSTKSSEWDNNDLSLLGNQKWILMEEK